MFTLKYIHLFLFILSTTHTVKVFDYQIYLSVRIYYTFVSHKKSECRRTENLRRLMMKARR